MFDPYNLKGFLMMISKTKSLTLFCAAGVTMLVLSACHSDKSGSNAEPDTKQSASEACNVVNRAGGKLLPEIGNAIQNTSADPSGTLKRFQTAATDFKTATASVGNPKVKEAKDLVSQDLDKMITTIGAVEAAGKAGKSRDDLRDMVREKLQPLANTFQSDWNNKLSTACGG